MSNSQSHAYMRDQILLFLFFMVLLQPTFTFFPSRRLSQSAGAFEARMAHGQLPHAQAVGLETAHQRIVGDHSGGGMAAAGEPATEDGEDIARAAPEPARRKQRNP